AEFDLRLVDLPLDSIEIRAAARLEKMLESGVLEEADRLEYSENSPIMKVIGAKTIKRFLAGEICMLEMKKLVILETRQYAKRQRTFFKTQFKT
ncbi:MAG: hypothetical protein FWD15_06205, partial [Alphaproteobacteria bacterium]|nr:hypothetical protein [Alphaproteobacteria bacterium]